VHHAPRIPPRRLFPSANSPFMLTFPVLVPNYDPLFFFLGGVFGCFWCCFFVCSFPFEAHPLFCRPPPPPPTPSDRHPRKWLVFFHPPFLPPPAPNLPSPAVPVGRPLRYARTARRESGAHHCACFCFAPRLFLPFPGFGVVWKKRLPPALPPRVWHLVRLSPSLPPPPASPPFPFLLVCCDELKKIDLPPPFRCHRPCLPPPLLTARRQLSFSNRCWLKTLSGPLFSSPERCFDSVAFYQDIIDPFTTRPRPGPWAYFRVSLRVFSFWQSFPPVDETVPRLFAPLPPRPFFAYLTLSQKLLCSFTLSPGTPDRWSVVPPGFLG